MRQLRDWILLLRNVIKSLSEECKYVLEDNLNAWKDRGRGGSALNLDGTPALTSEGDVPLPIGQGEWDEPLGLPLCVVCQNVGHSVFRIQNIANVITGREDGLPGEKPELERRTV